MPGVGDRPSVLTFQIESRHRHLPLRTLTRHHPRDSSEAPSTSAGLDVSTTATEAADSRPCPAP